MKAKSYYINTYGCQMNVHESEKMGGILSDRGFIQADSIEEANIIIYNTCCVRNTAETKVFGHLGRAKKLKELNKDIKIILCGCMSQQEGEAQNIIKKYPFIDIIIGTHNIMMLGDYLDKTKFIEVWKEAKIDREIDIKPRRERSVNAWINIMYGCNNFCSYCIVPFVRGRERSRGANEILDEIKNVLDNGYNEITLLGQNVNSYKYEDIDFKSLLEKIRDIKGKFRLKFLSSHPKDLSLDVIKIISETDNFSKNIHLPIQAGSDRILLLMNRGYMIKDYLNKVDIMKKFMPDLGLSTDIMVGFPSETEEEFLDTMNLINQVKFDNIFSFIYNRRSGTVADKMSGQISREIKIDRIQRLIKKQNEIGGQKAKECVDKKFEVLVEFQKGNKCIGKTDNGKPVSFESEDNVFNKFVDIKIIETKNTGLIGKPI
ncbi:MAG: tRNA (N6-isopentenyl adenosine(37)-C2)-methylthiotransferase MiaB [Firmicutes bacterium]|nr:tRNA (N6-isopentenyl adenosine(37)-C2)-methylthiotransferase MiaB [Bacillota bacterium]